MPRCLERGSKTAARAASEGPLRARNRPRRLPTRLHPVRLPPQWCAYLCDGAFTSADHVANLCSFPSRRENNGWKTGRFRNSFRIWQVGMRPRRVRLSPRNWRTFRYSVTDGGLLISRFPMKPRWIAPLPEGGNLQSFRHSAVIQHGPHP